MQDLVAHKRNVLDLRKHDPERTVSAIFHKRSRHKPIRLEQFSPLYYKLNICTHNNLQCNKSASQSCAVAKNEILLTGESNLADRMEDCFTGQSASV